MKYFVDLDINNKVYSIKKVNNDYINPGNSIEIESFNDKLLGTTYNAGAFTGYYIALTADKSTITADGTDKAVITAKVFSYDDTAAADYANGIVFDVNGTQQTVVPTNGEASIEFKSSIAGSFTIKTVNDVIRNGEVTIIAS